MLLFLFLVFLPLSLTVIYLALKGDSPNKYSITVLSFSSYYHLKKINMLDLKTEHKTQCLRIDDWQVQVKRGKRNGDNV